MSHAAVVGAGSWGTALACLLRDNGLDVTLWGHDSAAMERIRATRENAAYLPGVPLPAGIEMTSELEQVARCDVALIVVPSKAVREIASRLGAIGVPASTVLVSCTKGVERGSGMRMSEILQECLPGSPIAVLSGPSHAEEVARRVPTAVALGCADPAVARSLQAAISSSYFRTYTNDDVAGVELGGSLKNIFAIAAGAADGLGLGDNAKAALLTRSLAELIRVGSALGGRRETFDGLSGIGDLIVTCYSRHSRNRMVGERLGRGEALGAIVSSMQMVAEGVPTTYGAYECARRFGLATPIIDQIRAVLEGETTARAAMTALMTRELKAE